MAFSLIFYSFTIFTSGFDEKYGNSCVTLEEWFDLVKILVFIDTIQTMVVPFIIISVSNVLIVFKLMKRFTFKSNKLVEREELRKLDESNLASFQNQKNTLGTDESLVNFSSNNNNNSMVNNSFKMSRSETVRKSKSTNSKKSETRRHKSKSRSETTKTLIMISTTFLILNSPLAACKTYYFFKRKFFDTESPVYHSKLGDIVYSNKTFTPLYTNSFIYNTTTTLNSINHQSHQQNSEFETNTFEEITERITCFIYYINFSLNFFLYTFNTKQFRENILDIFKKFFKN
jgi:hypothetical protein